MDIHFETAHEHLDKIEPQGVTYRNLERGASTCDFEGALTKSKWFHFNSYTSLYTVRPMNMLVGIGKKNFSWIFQFQ